MQLFRIAIPQAELDDLTERLDRIRWAPATPAGSDEWDHGVPVAAVRELVERWRHTYDWREWERRLNEYPQFTTTIDGQNIHFLHIQSPEKNAIPLILTHGWPGSIMEFLDVIELLRDFHLVIPSLPGFAFSGPVTETGWGPQRIARAWATLMRQLGYDRYGAVGNDWGSVISPELGRIAPDAVIGALVTQMFSGPAGELPYAVQQPDPPELSLMTPEERTAFDGIRWWQNDGGSAYHHVHAKRPQTLAHAVSDSPVGLLGWNLQVMGGLDPDFILTNVMVYWLTRTAGSAMRIYYEDEKAGLPAEPTTVPIGLAQFRDDAQAIRRYADRDHANIVSWRVHDCGGHYASHQVPDVFADEVRTFFDERTR